MSDHQTDSDKTVVNQQEQEEQFNPNLKKQSKSKDKIKSQKKVSKQKQSKNVSRQKPKKKGGKKKQQKQQKQQKPKKQAKQVKQKQVKKKPKSKKAGGSQSFQQNKQKVKQYMKKQNRPYNLLNVFDNLHGKIKKPQLETILQQLVKDGQLSGKQFGKNKVYFINQDKFDLNMVEVNQLGSKYTELRQLHKQLKDQNKQLTDEYRKLMAKKTYEQLQLDQMTLANQINKLKKKRDYLVSGDIVKVDEKQVIAIQKNVQKLDKLLKKRKRLTKQCLQSWAEILEKKVPQVAEIMGIDLA